MLVLTLNEPIHFLVRNGDKGVSVATVGKTNDEISIRDYATEQNGDKHRVPRRDYFTVQLTQNIQVDCELIPDTNNIGIHASKNVTVLRESLMIKSSFAPDWLI